MEFKDYLTVAVAVIAIFSAFAGGIRWMVKHYLNELKPNGGSSMKDSMAHNTGYAVDLTHDPESGVDCSDIFEKLKEDKRVNYLIFNKKIWSKDKARLGNRPYTGSNSHTKHLHISINDGHGDDTSPWFWWMNTPKTVNQIVAALSSIPAKKAYKTEVCTCCKLHGAKS